MRIAPVAACAANVLARASATVRNSHCAIFWYSGSEKTKKPTSRWNSGSVTPKSLRWSHRTICCQSTTHDVSADDEPGAGRERQIATSRSAAGAAVRWSPAPAPGRSLDEPEVGQQEHRRPEPGEATRQPPAGDHRPEHVLLAELVEPQPLGLELRHDPGEHERSTPEHAEQQRRPNARPPPPRSALAESRAGPRRCAGGPIDGRWHATSRSSRLPAALNKRATFT